MRAVTILIGLMTATTVAAQDCECGKPPFVVYELNQEGLEFDENPWRVAVITHYDIDMTRVGEPETCEVRLSLIPATDPVLYIDFIEVSDNDFEINYAGAWTLASQFEAEMKKSHCLSNNDLS